MGATGDIRTEPSGWRFLHGRDLVPSQSKGVVAGH